MNLPKLSCTFPISQEFAKLYGGWTEGLFFKKIFEAETLDEQINKTNFFLKENGFEEEIENEIFATGNFQQYNFRLSFWKDGLGDNQIMIIYHQPVRTESQTEILKLLNKFRDDREWSKFHTPKNLSMALASEVGELMDLYLWDRDENKYIDKVQSELADIFIYSLYLADYYCINLFDAAVNKIVENDVKYPVAKSKGTAKKYNEL